MLSIKRVRDVPRPANGEYFVALMVGAPPELAAKYRQLLASVGVLLRHTWNEAHDLGCDVPHDVDLILIVPGPPWRAPYRREFMYRELALGRFVIDAKHRDDVIFALRSNGRVGPPVSLPWNESGGISIVPSAPVEAPLAPIVPILPILPTPPEPPEPLPLAAITQPRPPEPEETPTPMSDALLSDSESARLKEAGLMLKQHRANLGMSAGDVGIEIGKSSGYVYKLEVGALRMSDDACDRLEKLFNLKTGSLPRLSIGTANARPDKKAPTTVAPRKSTTKSAPVKVSINREQLISTLMRLQSELEEVGVEEFSITANHGEYSIVMSGDAFSVTRNDAFSATRK